jgi:hypothetical protein
LDAARVGPRVLLGLARLATGDVDAALHHLEPAAYASDEPSMLLARRHAVAAYAAALIAADRIDEAVEWAGRALLAPGEDARSHSAAHRVLARALARAGSLDAARLAAGEAAKSAYATEQRSERAASDDLLRALTEVSGDEATGDEATGDEAAGHQSVTGLR